MRLKGKPQRIVIEPKDLEIEGSGVEIQVQGFKGNREEIDALNTHVYIEKWEGETRIVVWCGNDVNPTIFKLQESTQDLADNDLFECTHCNRVLDIEESIKKHEELICEECDKYYNEED